MQGLISWVDSGHPSELNWSVIGLLIYYLTLRMGCGVTVLAIYAFVASLVVLVLSSLLVTMDGCDEDSLAETCKDLNVETGRTLTEVRNRF